MACVVHAVAKSGAQRSGFHFHVPVSFSTFHIKLALPAQSVWGNLSLPKTYC